MNINNNDCYKQQINKIAENLPGDFSVLVTGASGLIGSCLTDVFLSAGHTYGKRIKVFILGRNERKLRERYSYIDTDQLTYVIQDISKPLMMDESVDYIIHAASNADPVSYALSPVETLLTNIYGTNNILEYCKKHKKTRMLLTSTFEAYGKIKGQDIYKENDSGETDLNAIRSCYPESKRCAEILSRCYQKEYGVDFVIARLCSVYGPTMSSRDSKAHAQFIRNGLLGEDIVLKSKGEQKRTYCYVMDAISAIIHILFKGISGEAYNVSNEEGIVSIADVASEVARICGTKVVYDIPNEIELNGFSRPQNCILDNRKLKELGWTGHYSLHDGLVSTIRILQETGQLI